MIELIELPDGAGWRLGDTEFVFAYGHGSSADRFLIRKPPDLVALYVELTDRFRGATIVELGIAAGGSTALLSLLAEPTLLVACELAPDPVAALSEFIRQHDLESVVRPFYGVNQADRTRIAEIADVETAGCALDLVIDDASHLYNETLASFEVLYPRLRPGGVFIIEDWAADYAYARRIATALADRTSPSAAALEARLAEAVLDDPRGPTPLPRIGIELLHVAAEAGDVVSELQINRHWLAVERGPAELDPDTFRLADHFVDHWGWISD